MFSVGLRKIRHRDGASIGLNLIVFAGRCGHAHNDKVKNARPHHPFSSRSDMH